MPFVIFNAKKHVEPQEIVCFVIKVQAFISGNELNMSGLQFCKGCILQIACYYSLLSVIAKQLSLEVAPLYPFNILWYCIKYHPTMCLLPQSQMMGGEKERVPVKMSLKLLLQQKVCWFIWCAVVRDSVYAAFDIQQSTRWCVTQQIFYNKA